MGKHCLQLVLTLLPLFSPYAQRFSEQTDEKNPCWAVFSVMCYLQDGRHNKCMCASMHASMFSFNIMFVIEINHSIAIPFLFCCYVTYRIVYRIVTNVSGCVSYRRKMYRCRPRYKLEVLLTPGDTLGMSSSSESVSPAVRLRGPRWEPTSFDIAAAIYDAACTRLGCSLTSLVCKKSECVHMGKHGTENTEQGTRIYISKGLITG